MGEFDGLDGGTLRAKLEAALAELRIARASSLKAKYDMAEDKDFIDLKADASFEDWEERAKEVQGQRKEQAKGLLKKAGLSDEQIAAVMAGEAVTAEGGQKPEPPEGVRRIVKAASAGDGARPGVTPDASFVGADAIHEHFRRKADKAK